MPEAPSPLPSADDFFDLAPSGFLILSPSGQILKVNQTFCRWVGASAEELVGHKRLQDFFTMGGRIYHQTHWMPMLDMQGSLSEVKFDLRGGDGTTFPVLLNAVRRRMGTDCHDLITVVSARERNLYERELLAARKWAEELLHKERDTQVALRVTQSRLQQAMQLQAIFFWDVEPATQRRRYGDEVALLLGHQQPMPVSEDVFLSAMHADDRAAERMLLQQSLASAEAYHATYRLRGVDGVERVVVASGQGFADDAGQLVQFVGTLVDVTESQRLRESAEDRALFAEQMVGIVSHDLRNPLQTVSLSTQVLRRGGAVQDAKALRILSTIDRAATRAQRLISDLLDFTAARVGSGLSVHRRPADIHQVVARAVEELALAFPDGRLVHRTEGPGAVTADVDRVVQLIGNLVGNALSYGEQRQPVTVTSAVNGLDVSLSVHNLGKPIPADQQASLFKPMVRGDDVQGALRGVGLGLFIVQAIARAHGGDVQVTSTAEAGTEFVFRFRRE